MSRAEIEADIRRMSRVAQGLAAAMGASFVPDEARLAEYRRMRRARASRPQVPLGDVR